MTSPSRANAPITAAAIAALNLRRLARDRLGLFFVAVLPLLIILLFGVAGGGSGDSAVGVVSGSDGPLARELVEGIDDTESIDVTRYGSRGELETAVRRRSVAAGVMVPPDYDERVADGDTATIEVIADPSGTVPAAVRATVAGAAARQNVRLQTAQIASAEIDVDFEEALDLADEVGGAEGLMVRAETTAGTAAEPALVDRAAAGNLVLFVFITSLVGSAALIESRRLGVSRRMLAAPTTPGAVLAGEALGRFAVALLQGAIVIVGAALLFGARWHDPLTVWLVVALLSLVGTGAAMILGSAFDNPEQAQGVAIPLGIGMGMLGGCMWPRDIVPPAMQAVGLVTPHAWAMDALDTVLAGGAGAADVARELVVLLGFAAAALGAAVYLFSRSLRRPTASGG